MQTNEMKKTQSSSVSSGDNIEVRKKLPKRTLMATVMILLCIPATIAAGIFILDDRSYYIVSLIIIVLSMLPFAMVFESRRPQARELVVIAVLVAIAVAGRAAFFMVPQFKPVVAIVIIAGVSFGAESGFVVGALTGFVSNFIFGQGPWTPWQMFAFGIIGFFAGILFSKGKLYVKPISLCIFGGLATFIIYGLLLDTASVMMFTYDLTRETILTTYTMGVPFNLIHAAATVVFLLIIAKPMIEKLARIKKKYGLVE